MAKQKPKPKPRTEPKPRPLPPVKFGEKLAGGAGAYRLEPRKKGKAKW